VQVTLRDDGTFCRVHHVRSLRLTDASQNVESLVLVIRDVTAWHSLEERFERTFACDPAPALICRLSDARHCVGPRARSRGLLITRNCAIEVPDGRFRCYRPRRTEKLTRLWK